MTGEEVQNIVGIILSLKQLYDTFNPQPEQKEQEIPTKIVQTDQPTKNQIISYTESTKLFDGQNIPPTLSPSIGTYELFPEAIRSARTETIASKQ